MVRLQLHITERQDKALRAASRRQGQSRAELIRVAIDAWLSQEQSGRDPLLSIIGAAGPAGRTDLSESVDALLYGQDANALPLAAEREKP